VSPAFDSLWWMPLVLAAFCDHPTLQQRGDDIALIFIEQASDIGHVEPVVEKEVANRNASLGLGIEIHAVSRYIKFSLTHLEAISSSFTVSLLHLDTFEKRSKFHGIKTERGLPSIDGSVGHLYRPPGDRQGKRQDDHGDELKRSAYRIPRGNEQALWRR